MMLTMTIVLTHTSALEYWRSAECSRYSIALRARSLISVPPKIDFNPGLSLPIHALVSQEKLRRNSRKITCHTWTHPLPKGYILDLG